MNQSMAETIFWIAAVACVIAEVAILRSTFAARPANRSELVPASSRSGELAWAVIPALGLCRAGCHLAENRGSPEPHADDESLRHAALDANAFGTACSPGQLR